MKRSDDGDRLHESYLFEIDEFDYVCSERSAAPSARSGPPTDDQRTMFHDIFADAGTRALFRSVLDHVRATSETVSFPYRCDTDTHYVFMRAVVFKSSSRRVGFLNRIIGREPRATGVRMLRAHVLELADFTACSICSRLKHGEEWIEFQQLVERGLWPPDERIMRCALDTCPDCENAVAQRIAESRRSFERKTA